MNEFALKFDPEVLAAKEDYRRQLDIEDAIMHCPAFDYLSASEIFAALHRRLEQRYEGNLNTELADRMDRLSQAFDHITGNL